MTRGITTEDGYLSSYQQIERIALGLGLAFWALWIAQFPDDYHHVPIYVLNSPYPFVEYDQLGHLIKNLIDLLLKWNAASTESDSRPTPHPKEG